MEQTDISRNTLFLSPAHDAATDRACIDHLIQHTPERTNILAVTLTQSPDERIEIWRRLVGDAIPANTSFVCVDESTRSASSTSVKGCYGKVSVEIVSSPGDLTNLGVAITNTLSEWSENDQQSVLCFHSLTPILQYVEPRDLFRFLHVLIQNVKSTGTIAHYHLDPTAHDEQTVNLFKSVVDSVIDSRSVNDQRDESGKVEFDDSTVVEHGLAVDNGDFGWRRFRFQEGEQPSSLIIRAIAAMEGVKPDQLEEPLFESIEPDALDSMLFQPPGSSVGSVTIEFTYGGYLVRADGEMVEILGVAPRQRDDGA